jgi:TPR repeat protein
MPLWATAGLFEQGEAAMKAGDHKQAASLFQSAAVEGIPQAQFMLGALYETGKGVPCLAVRSVHETNP